jgi:hypothetical protein
MVHTHSKKYQESSIISSSPQSTVHLTTPLLQGTIAWSSQSWRSHYPTTAVFVLTRLKDVIGEWNRCQGSTRRNATKCRTVDSFIAWDIHLWITKNLDWWTSSYIPYRPMQNELEITQRVMLIGLCAYVLLKPERPLQMNIQTIENRCSLPI